MKIVYLIISNLIYIAVSWVVGQEHTKKNLQSSAENRDELKLNVDGQFFSSLFCAISH